MSEPYAEALLFYGLVFKRDSLAHNRLDDLVADVGMALYGTARARLGTHGPMDAPCYHVAAVDSIHRVTHQDHVTTVFPIRVGTAWNENVRRWCRMRGVPMMGVGHPAWHLAVTYEP